MALCISCCFFPPPFFGTSDWSPPLLCPGRKQPLTILCGLASARDMQITLGNHEREMLGVLLDSTGKNLEEELLSFETIPAEELNDDNQQTETLISECCLDRLVGEATNPKKLASLLKRCGTNNLLYDGRRVHAHICTYGYDSNRFLANCLVQMYGNCASVEDAQAAFDRVGKPNLYSWNLLMKAYVENRRFTKAKTVFTTMPQRDVVSWSTMIAACAQFGHGEEALELFQQMQREGVKPNVVTFVCVLDAYAGLADLEEAEEVHAHIIDSGFEQNLIVANALINMYGKRGYVNTARKVFDRMNERDRVSWNSMIAAYAQNDYGKEALELFRQMQVEGIKPNKISFVSAVNACASPALLEEGKNIHSAIFDSGFVQDVVVGTALVTMYGKCGSLHDARIIFREMPVRNLVSWNAMIAACIQNGQAVEALDLFHQMQAEGLKPDKITFICALHACGSLGALQDGQEIHSAIMTRGYQRDVGVGTALVNMYGKCGSLGESRSVFHRIRERNVVSWGVMIVACVENGHGREALDLFRQRRLDGIKPDKVTFICLLDACISIAALEDGREIHAAIIDCGFEQDTVTWTALINMYGKCGSLHDAKSVFNRMFQQDVVSWSAMIDACAQNGHGKEALELFHQMQLDGINPNSITFLSLLIACRHAGLLERARCYFASMTREYGFAHTMDHYVCMIDILGRSGHLEEAEDLINHLPFKEIAPGWLCLLGACTTHGDLDRGIRAAKHCLELDPKNAAPYKLMSNLYAAAGRWEKVATVKEALKNSGAKKLLERSCIHIDRMIHEFVGGMLHAQNEEIHAMLLDLSAQLRQAGYELDAHRVTPKEEEEMEEDILCYHTVRLAITFGLMHTPSGTPLLVSKNFKMCAECHTVIKFISKIVERKFSVRDTDLFHHFEHGMCSCRDFW